MDVESAVDALYQAPLDRFTADRNALAAALKKAGDKAASEHVKSLTKPAATAWAVNQVWWQHRARLEALLAAGVRQREAHVAWTRGESVDVREAAEARQRAVADVTEAALEALGGRKAVAPDLQYRIAGTLEALAAGGWPSGETPGRLTRDLQSSGLDALSALAAAAGPATRPAAVSRATPPPPSPPAKPPVPRIDREARLAAARAALEAAAGVAEATANDESRARDALAAATERRGQLETELDAAKAEEAAARRALSQATAAALRAQMDRARAERDLGRL